MSIYTLCSKSNTNKNVYEKPNPSSPRRSKKKNNSKVAKTTRKQQPFRMILVERKMSLEIFWLFCLRAFSLSQARFLFFYLSLALYLIHFRRTRHFIACINRFIFKTPKKLKQHIHTLHSPQMRNLRENKNTLTQLEENTNIQRSIKRSCSMSVYDNARSHE